MTQIHPSIAAIGPGISGLITRHIDLAFREIIRVPTVVFDPRFVQLVTGEPHPFGNFALVSDPATVATTEAAIEPLRHCKVPSAAFFAGAVSESIVTCLKSAGFEQHPGLPAMAVDIEKVRKTELPAGYTFARLSGATHRDAWAQVFALGYGLPQIVGEAFAGGIDKDLTDDSLLQYFWILKDGKPVCTSLQYLKDGVAGIYGVATLPEERGKGLGAFVTAEPLRIAHRLGYKVGVLQASAEGHPVYRRLGFSDFGELPLFVRMPV